MQTIVFACVQNAGRSQMAAAFCTLLADPGRVRAVSGGTRPAARVHGEVVEAMREIGIDLSAAVPQALPDAIGPDVSWLVTMGCGDECPVAPGVRREDWPLRDPHRQPPEVVRAIRDEIRARVLDFLHREGLAAAPIAHLSRRSVSDGDVREIVAFVTAQGLPAAGLAEHATDLFVARAGGAIAGAAALEVYGGDALLRSVAVASAWRGTGLGQRLTHAALAGARQRGVERVYLLTETAAGFFPKFGFADVERPAVPPSISGTVEFAKACPASARVMVKVLE